MEKNLEHLKATVLETKADLGIAYDGDADRVGVVDEKGNVLWGDQIMILFSRALLAEHPGAAIVGEVKCSMSLYDDIAKHGGRGIMWKAGHSLIKAKMKEEQALLAGEMSGHIFFAHRWFGFDDGDLLVGAPARALSRTEQPLSALLADVPRTESTPELRVRLPRGEEVRGGAARPGVLRGALRGGDVDGVRVVVPGRLGARARVQHAAPARAALRGAHEGAARRDRGARARQGAGDHAGAGGLAMELGIGVDLGGTNARAAVVDADTGEVIAAHKEPLRDRTPDGVVDVVRHVIAEAAAAAGVTAGAVGAVGVGVAGQCLGRTGVVLNAPNLGWRDVAFGELLREAIGIPVRVANDLSVAGMGREALWRREGDRRRGARVRRLRRRRRPHPGGPPLRRRAGRRGRVRSREGPPDPPRDRGAALRLRPARLPRGLHLRRERRGARAGGDRSGCPDRRSTRAWAAISRA